MKNTKLTVKFFTAIIISGLLFTACGSKESTLEAASLSELENTSEIPKVTVAIAKKMLFEHYFEIQGNIEAAKNAILLPEAGGIIRSINVQEGQMISAGQTIATFDSEVIASNMKELEEQLDLAKYMFDKQKSLYDQGVGTELALKQAEGQYLSLEKTMSTLKTQKGKFILSAPFAGYVEEIFPVVGEMAGPASPIIRLINLDKVSVKADISESYLSKINESNKADVYFPALDSKNENLTIKRVGKFINPINRTLTIEVEIPNPTSKHVPNLTAVLHIRDYLDSNAVVIPSNVILESSKGKPYVKIINTKNQVEIRNITTKMSYQGNTEIIAGLNDGDVVIADGKGSVVEGQTVEISKK